MTCSLLVRRSVRIVENWYILPCFSNAFLHPLFLSLPISFAHSFLLFPPSLSSSSLSRYSSHPSSIFLERCRFLYLVKKLPVASTSTNLKMIVWFRQVIENFLGQLFWDAHSTSYIMARNGPAVGRLCLSLVFLRQLRLTSPLSLLLPTVPSLEFNTVCFILHLRLRCLNGSFHSFKMQQMFNIFPSQFFFRDGAGGWAVAGGGAVTTSFERWLLKCRVLSGIHSAMKSRWRLLSRMH